MKIERLTPHRHWLLLFGAAILLALAGLPLIDYGIAAARHRAEDIAAERAELQQAATRFHEDVQLAERPDGRMTAEDIDRLLAPVDRLRMLAGLERQAASRRLSHFTYALSPEKKAKIDVMEAADMAVSELTLTADMPLDIDCYAFLQSIGSVLPGRTRLRQLSLTRIANDSPLSLANLHMEAVLEWLSNGAAQKQAGLP